jgi:hypothetical protein
MCPSAIMAAKVIEKMPNHLEIEIIESSVQRIRGRWRGTQNPNEVWKYVDFIAPNQSNSYDRTSGI